MPSCTHPPEEVRVSKQKLGARKLYCQQCGDSWWEVE